MKQIYELHAEVCKALANPKRIEIINLLRSGEKSVTWLLKKTGLLKANLSQHLSVMRQRGIIKARKEGLAVYYRIANPKIVKACDLMREVLFEQMRERGKIMKKFFVVVLTMIAISQFAFADTEFWSTTTFQFPVREKVKFDVIPEVRIRNNLSDLYYFRTYLGPSLSLNKNFGINIYYAPNYIKSSNNWTALGYLDAIYKTDFPWFSFSNRGRFEYDFTLAILKYRNLFWFGRNGWFASDELFYNVNLGFFDEGRSSFGYSTKVFGDIGLSLSYLLRRQRTNSTADWQRTSVINLGLKTDL